MGDGEWGMGKEVRYICHVIGGRYVKFEMKGVWFWVEFWSIGCGISGPTT